MSLEKERNPDDRPLKLTRIAAKYTIALGVVTFGAKAVGSMFAIDRLREVPTALGALSLVLGSLILWATGKTDDKNSPHELNTRLAPHMTALGIELGHQKKSRDFFESDNTGRAPMLRDGTLAFLSAYSARLYGDDVPDGSLLDTSKVLRDGGVTNDMHVCDPDDPNYNALTAARRANPVAYTEFVAGQVLAFVDKVGLEAPPEQIGAAHTFIGLAFQLLDGDAGFTQQPG